jgi:hypothetical protein
MARRPGQEGVEVLAGPLATVGASHSPGGEL